VAQVRKLVLAGSHCTGRRVLERVWATLVWKRTYVSLWNLSLLWSGKWL